MTAALFDNLHFSAVQNRNEKRVLAEMRRLFSKGDDDGALTEENILQIYALALNLLPARYGLKGTLILRDPVQDEDITKAVQRAFVRVTMHPKD